MTHLIEITVSTRDANLAADIYRDMNFRACCGIASVYTDSYIGPDGEIEDFNSDIEAYIDEILDAVDRNPELNDFKPDIHKLLQFGSEVSVLLW